MFRAIRTRVARGWGVLFSEPAALFKAFVVAVLVQFAFLSIWSAQRPPELGTLPVLRTMFGSADFCWGILSLFGAASIAADGPLRHCRPIQGLGYAAAVSSFAFLAWDFALRKPPVYVGGVLSATAAVFLAVLLWERLRHA